MSMLSSNNQPMIISQHKRTSYDKDGSVNKVDILRSIRRKDAQPSFLPSFLTQKENNEKEHQGNSRFKDIVEYLLIATIIFCSFLLIMSLCGISLQLTETVSNTRQKIVQSDQDKILFPNLNCTGSNHCNQRVINQTVVDMDGTVMNYFFEQFSKQLEETKENDSDYQEENKVKLSEMRKVMKIDDENKWRLLLSTFAENLNCRIEFKKIICQHELDV